MRQSIKAAGLASLLLLSLTDLSAEPLVKGFFVEKLPANSLNKALAPGKGLVLAHVLNQSNEAIVTGNYQVGVQVEDKGSIKTYSLSPKDSITPGALKTFRMAIPIEGIDKNTGLFRVFSRVNGITTWSEKYSFMQGIHSSKDKNGVTTLYTEAPIANEDRIVPKEVPFENQSSTVNKSVSETDSSTKKVEKTVKDVENKNKKEVAKASKTVEKKKNEETSSIKTASNDTKNKSVKESVKETAKEPVKETTKVAAKDSSKQVNEKTTVKTAEKPKDKPSVSVAEAKSSAVRKINPSEFKKLRTMDEELIIYVVKNGDTLKSISENYYGTASKERVIADLNFIEKSSAVRVGEEIIVEVRPLSKSKS